MTQAINDLKYLLEPRSLAVIGASRSSGKKTNVLENLLSYGFSGNIYPVNPKATEILGLKAYASVADIPDEIDLALISTPRSTVIPIVEECAKKGIKVAIVVAQGFADANDEEGRNLQKNLVRIAEERGIRIVGPNTFGVGNGFINLNTAFVFLKPEKIPVGAVGQSGLSFAVTTQSQSLGKAVDIGNACDVGFCDVLEYFKEDPDIKIIVLYIEGLPKDGNKFLEIARETAKKKPILALRGGKTEEGAKKVQSHTGSLAVKNEIWKAAFRQNGIIEVDDMGEIDDIVKAYLNLPLPRGNKLAIMTYPMSAGIMATDACQKHGLEVAKLSPQTVKELEGFFPSWAPVGNPVDMAVPALVAGNDPNIAFKTILKALLSDTEVAGVVTITPAPNIDELEFYDHSQVMIETIRNFEKPVLPWLYFFHEERLGIKKYEEKGIAVFPTFYRAIKAFSRLYYYNEWRNASE